MALVVEHVHKSFGQFQAISDLSLEVQEGALFGLLGPNGAGKTTTMRMILDIFRPDSGRITWNGKDVREVARRNWGYLPEERGLYRKMAVDEQLLFLARLYGVSKPDAAKEVDTWLERFHIRADRRKKIEELSKGNQQKVQFLAAVLHDPSVLILDEPFSGLDPVNANVLKEAFVEMHRRGKTIIFSTHQLEQAEELCQDIAIIHKGRGVMQGSIAEIKRRHGRNVVRLKIDDDPEATWLDVLPGVTVTKRRQDYIEMDIPANFDANRIVEAALQHGGVISRFELAEPSLTDIFIEQVSATGQPDVRPAS
jgi:ABC-2 type transport system ATP-binding protein